MWRLYLIGAGIAALIAGGFIVYYRHISDEAAKVPGLERQISDADKLADDLAVKLAAAEAARHQADLDFSAWQRNAARILADIKNGGAHAAAAANPACAPGDDDRRLRNEALNRLAGSGPYRGTASLPNAANAAR